MRSRRSCWRRVAWIGVMVLFIGAGFVTRSFGQECSLLAGYENFGLHNRFPNDMVIDGHFAYTADAFGLTIYDFSDRSHPVKVGQLFLSEEGWHVAISDTYAYVTGKYDWLYVIDISDPTSPRLMGSSGILGHGWVAGLAVSGTTLYVGSDETLQVLDVSNPASPQYLADCPTVLDVSDTLTGTDGIAYVSPFEFQRHGGGGGRPLSIRGYRLFGGRRPPSLF